MKSLLLSFILPVSLFAQISPASLVNPFIGTGGHGHTFPGATTPFGMVQLSPDSRIDGSWDGCGGYHYSDSIIYGFSHTHLSGTGVSDYGDIMLMPMPYGKASLDKQEYSSTFSHQNENAGAGWYEVYLDKHSIKTELTATTRVGFHRYTFEQNSGSLVLDLLHRDKLFIGEIEQIGPTRIRGYRISEAWAKEQHVYFEMEFSQKITDIQIDGDFEHGDVNAILLFSEMTVPSLEVKVGISLTDMDGAKQNLDKEASALNFDKAKTQAINQWNEELSRIQVKGGSDEQQKIFYSALYHTMIQPNTANDVDGRYRGMDQKIHKAEDFTYYTVFSLWDTFRAAHPLYTILYPERSRDFIRTFLKMYEQGGRLPVWELAANETDCMIGYHSVSVIADAWIKGIRDFDAQLALQAMQKSANWNHLGLPDYTRQGYLMIDDESESVSKTLEYCYDDWCIAQFAKELGIDSISEMYFLRSQGWKNLFDQSEGSSQGFMRPKLNGAWLEPFDPFEVNNHYTEANSWQYSFFVPHDLQALKTMYSNADGLINKLNLTFNTTSKTSGREQSDITGLIGQYAHGNEPSHHMAWMFTELGEPKLGQTYVNRILRELYFNAPDGLSGNEDCGQMSAWYVLSAIGFYPFCPGSPEYTVGNPIFNEIQITPQDGKTFTIKTSGTGDWVSSVNGTTRFLLNHSDIVAGKTIQLERSEKAPISVEPNMKYLPGKTILPVPVIKTSQKVFRDQLKVSVTPSETNSKLFYTINGETPDKNSNELKLGEELVLDKTCHFQVLEVNGDRKSTAVSARYFKIPHNYTIEISSKYNPQYTAGGDQGIIDGVFADEDWRKGGWQGYQGQDFECVIDMQKPNLIYSVNASFLQDTRSWILLPTEVEYFTSLNGIDWVLFGSVSPAISANDYNVQRWNAVFNSGRDDGKPEPMFIAYPVNARYVKVQAKNFGKLPEWHLGAGGDAYIFIDEIAID
ncbi:MAG: GH92 family glycosyl hydrolase [Bacteroidia bacterium]